MSKKPKIALPDLDDPEVIKRRLACHEGKDQRYIFFQSAWKYVNEPRVIFSVRVLRCAKYPTGITTLIGVPESLVGKPKLEKRWIMYELGGHMVKLKFWRPFILPEYRRKRLLY